MGSGPLGVEMSTTAEPASRADEVPYLNITDPRFGFDSPEVAAARAASWYAQSPIGILVLRHAEAQELLRDRRLDHGGREYMARNGITDGPIYDWYLPMMVNRDGADHRRIRGLVNKAFTPRTVEGLRPFIRATVQRLTEGLAAAEVAEFVDGFANRLPLAVMCELLGVPPADYDRFSTWTTDVGLVFSLASGGDVPGRVEAAVAGLSGYVDTLIEQKRSRPGGDLISALVAAHRTDGTVSEEELRNLIVTLVFAAHDNTRHQLANGMVAFSQHPEQWALLAGRPELAPRAVEELLRWCPSATTLFRCATEEFDFRGVPIEKGTFLTVCITVAQRDPLAYPGGDVFDIAVPRSAPLLQFGAGPHHCLGSALARTEIGEALPVLTGRLGAPAIAGPVTWRPSLGIYGPNELPLRFG
jgi:cytochrome P450